MVFDLCCGSGTASVVATVMGMGAIGMGVAQRLTAFGCSLAYSDPGVDNVGYEKLDLQTLFATSEAVILTCNLNSSTFLITFLMWVNGQTINNRTHLSEAMFSSHIYIDNND